jgi:hypothetical protein
LVRTASVVSQARSSRGKLPYGSPTFAGAIIVKVKLPFERSYCVAAGSLWGMPAWTKSRA